MSTQARGTDRSAAMRIFVAAFAGLWLSVGCGSEAATRFAERRQVEEIWLHHQKAVSRALNGYYRDDEFDQARAFFVRLTGVEIRVDSLPSGDLVASPEAGEDLEQVRNWYAQNNDRLYLDESSGTVQIHDPFLSHTFACLRSSDSAQRAARRQQAQETWRRHEAVVVRALQGHQEDDELERALLFFADLTGIEIDANFFTLGVLPGPGSARDLEQLRVWYARNKERLYFDEDSLSVEVAPQ